MKSSNAAIKTKIFTLEELACFRSRPEPNTNQNHSALYFAIHGLDLFEVPSANLGTPEPLIDALGGKANLIAYYSGLGKAILTGFMHVGKKDVPKESLFDFEPVMLISDLVGYGRKFNAINIIARKNPQKQKKPLAGRLADLFAKDSGSMKAFMHSIQEAKRTSYFAIEPLRLYHRPIEANAKYFVNVYNSIEAEKAGTLFDWKIGGKPSYRSKTRSLDKERYGQLYFTFLIGETHRCTCPGGQYNKPCKHVNSLRESVAKSLQ